MCSLRLAFLTKQKNEQHTTDNEIKLHETNRKMNSTTRQIIFLFLLLQQNAKQQNAKASINTKAQRRESWNRTRIWGRKFTKTMSRMDKEEGTTWSGRILWLCLTACCCASFIHKVLTKGFVASQNISITLRVATFQLFSEIFGNFQIFYMFFPQVLSFKMFRRSREIKASLRWKLMVTQIDRQT